MKQSTAFKLVADELELATEKYGAFNSAHEGYAVIREELDELWDEVKADGSTHRAASEAVQVAAMAIRYLMDLCEEQRAVEHTAKVETWRDRVGFSGSSGGGCYSG